jgi:hypothetical protein
VAYNILLFDPRKLRWIHSNFPCVDLFIYLFYFSNYSHLTINFDWTRRVGDTFVTWVEPISYPVRLKTIYIHQGLTHCGATKLIRSHRGRNVLVTRKKQINNICIVQILPLGPEIYCVWPRTVHSNLIKLSAMSNYVWLMRKVGGGHKIYMLYSFHMPKTGNYITRPEMGGLFSNIIAFLAPELTSRRPDMG